MAQSDAGETGAERSLSWQWTSKTTKRSSSTRTVWTSTRVCGATATRITTGDFYLLADVEEADVIVVC